MNEISLQLMKNYFLGLMAVLFSINMFADNQSVLTQKIALPDKRIAYIYNNGAKIDIKSATGELQQSSCFSDCGISFAAAKEFLQQLQHAMKNNNKVAVSKLVAYPLRINGQKIIVRTPRDLHRQYSKIFTKTISQIILDQNPYTLFANSQGVMLGGGEVWCNEHRGQLRITVLNLPRVAY